MHESELSFQAIVDPYARADFFISFGEEGVELEEGFITFTALPGGLLTKVGKMRAAFGKVNTLHNHVLPWTDRPLVTQNLVGGEDGIDDAGISVARLIPNPWIFLEATGQVFRGDSGERVQVEQARRSELRRPPARLSGHHRDRPTSISAFSYARGHNASGIVDDVDSGRFTTSSTASTRRCAGSRCSASIYHSFVGRSELIWSRRDQPDGLQSADRASTSRAIISSAGAGLPGARYDRSGRADDASLHDTGGRSS